MIGSPQTRWRRRPHHSRQRVNNIRAFTLLEMIIVLTLMGIVIGLSAPAVVRSSGVNREQNALGELVSALAAQRLSAIQSGQGVAADLFQGDDQLDLDIDDTERVFTRWPLVLIDQNHDDAQSVALSFDPKGRSPVDRILFRSASKPTRIWEITFDPIGGVPTAHRLREASSP